MPQIRPGIAICAHMQVFLTFAPVNDHVMPSDVSFIVIRCAHVARGDDVIIYDMGNLVVMSCVHYLVLSEAVCCVEVCTYHCRHVVGGWGLTQVFNSFCYPVFYA